LKVIEGDKARVIEPVYDAENRLYEFPCGCRFKVRDELPDVNGHHAIEIDRDAYDESCPLVWDLFAEGLTTGVFQLESPLGKRYSEKLKPESVEHLAALVALLRPGVLKAKDEKGVNMADLFCYRKNGVEPVVVDIPDIEDILGPTYQIMLYQEQLCKIAARLARFDKVEADSLRSAVSKKKVDLVNELGVLFVDRCEEVGRITREQAIALYENIKKSGKYIFNLAHSVAYGLNAFETAYLKVHFPVYFFASYLEYANEKMDPIKEVRKLIRDARRFGIKVLTPRFVDLEPRFSTDNVKVRFGLANIKGVGEKAVDKMRQGLQREALMTWDWWKFLTLGSALCGASHLRNIIKAGGMDEYDLPRLRMLAELDAWNGLTEKEQGAVMALGDPVYKGEKTYREEEQEVKVPVFEKGAKKRYDEELKAWRHHCHEVDMVYEGLLGCDDEAYADAPDYPPEPTPPTPIGTKIKLKKVKVEDGEERILVDPARPCHDLETALENLLARPGAVLKSRRVKVESHLSLLRNPPYPLEDTAYMIANDEENLLGVAITASQMDEVDDSIADTTVLEYIEGKDDDSMTIACEVLDFMVREVKNGDNRGRKMATLDLGDGDQVIEGAVAFPDAWEQYASVLMRPKAVVAVEGKRSYRDGRTFFINKAWSLS